MLTRYFVGKDALDHAKLTEEGTTASAACANAWDVENQQQVGASIPGYKAGASVMSLSPGGDAIALTSGTDSMVLLWDLKEKKIKGELMRSHRDAVTSVAFSPDGKLLALTYADPDIYARLLDPKTHKFLELDPDKYSAPLLHCIAFSPDGTMLAAGGGMGQGEVLLWNVETHRRLGGRINASTTEVTSISFSPDGSTLASGSLDGTVRLWDPVSHDLIATLAEAQKFKRVAASLAYSPDGKLLAWGNEADGKLICGMSAVMRD